MFFGVVEILETHREKYNFTKKYVKICCDAFRHETDYVCILVQVIRRRYG